MPSPSDLSGLLWWATSTSGRFDAVSGGSSVTADGATVASWAPTAGSVTDRATQSTSGNRMKYDATKQMLVCEPSQDQWLIPPAMTVDRQSHTFAFIVEMPTLTAGTAGAANAAYKVFMADSSATYLPAIKAQYGTLMTYAGGDYYPSPSMFPLSPTRTLIIFRGSGANLKIDNGLVSRTISSVLSAGTYSPAGLFAYANGDYPVQGGLLDVVVFSRAISDSEITNTIVPWAQDRGVTFSFANYVIAAGDSITYGASAQMGRGWTQSLSLGSDFAIRTNASSGKRISELYSERATLTAPLAESGKVNILVIWAGTNDIATTNDAAGTFAVLESYRDWALLNGFDHVVAVTPLPRGAGAISGQYATYRNLILAGTFGAIADPISDATLAAAWGDGTYDADGIHPNAAGYALITPYIQDAILSLLQSTVTITETTLERGQAGQTLHVQVSKDSTATTDWTLAVGGSSGSITAGNFSDPRNPILTVTAPQTSGTATLTYVADGGSTTITVQDTTAPSSPTGVSAGTVSAYSVPVSFTLPSPSPAGETVTATMRKNSTVVATGQTSSPYTFVGVVDGDVLKVRSVDNAGNESSDTTVTFAAPTGGGGLLIIAAGW